MSRTCNAAAVLWPVLLGVGCALVGGLDGDFVLRESSASSGGSCGDCWAHTYSDFGEQMVTDVAATSDGGVVIVGVFSLQVDFGGLGEHLLEGPKNKSCPDMTTPSQIACPDAFVAKLSGEGTVEWTHAITSENSVGDGSVYALMPDPSVAVDPMTADVYVAFQCESADADDTSDSDEPIGVAGESDVCLATWNANGDFSQSYSVGSSESDDVGPLVLLGAHPFVGVVTGGEVASGEGMMGKGTYVMKLGAEELEMYDTKGISVGAMTSNDDDALYVTGSTLGAAGGERATEAYVVKLSTDETENRRMEDWRVDSDSSAGAVVKPTAIAFDSSDGSVIVGGAFTGETKFDSAAGTMMVSPPSCTTQEPIDSCHNGFVVRYGAEDGGFVDDMELESDDHAWISDVAVRRDGTVSVAAWITGRVDFGDVGFFSVGPFDLSGPEVFLVNLTSGLTAVDMPYTLFGSSSDDYVTAVDAADDHMFVGGMINGQAQLYAGAISSDDVFGVHTAPDAFVLKLGSF